MILPALSFLLFALTMVMNHPTDDLVYANSSTTIMPPNHNPLTSHVLDMGSGRPSEGIKVTLYKRENEQWRLISETYTNSDGRIGNIISAEDFTPAIYKLYFDTKAYYEGRGEKTFYPFIEIAFEIERPEEHYHVPILLSCYGFSTYRGS